MKKIILLITLILSPHVIKTETLFVKADGSPLTPDEHAIAYKIMLENQFPMSIRYGKYTQDEFDEMSQKIAPLLPTANITLQFIPTTLYQLLALKFIQDHFSPLAGPLKSDSDDQLFIATGGMLKSNPPTTIKTRTPHYFVVRANKILKNSPDNQNSLFTKEILIPLQIFHLNVNNWINKTLAEKSLNTSFHANALKALNEFNFESINLTPGLRKYPIRKSIMQQAITIEFDAFKKNQFVLYRGASTLDFERPEKNDININRSISFGASLLGGCLFDNEPADADGYRGACAYSYICCISKHPYALPIDKNSYANGPLDTMFIIPAIPTLLEILCQGEEYHPRSKIADIEKTISGYDDTNKENISMLQIKTNQLPRITHKKNIDALTVEKKPTPPRVVYSQMLQYIKEHQIPLKK